MGETSHLLIPQVSKSETAEKGKNVSKYTHTLPSFLGKGTPQRGLNKATKQRKRKILDAISLLFFDPVSASHNCSMMCSFSTFYLTTYHVDQEYSYRYNC